MTHGLAKDFAKVFALDFVSFLLYGRVLPQIWSIGFKVRMLNRIKLQAVIMLLYQMPTYSLVI